MREFKAFKPETSIFKNFQDERKRPLDAAAKGIHERISGIRKGEGVVIVLSKDEFGKVNMPLDLMGAETIF